MQQWRCRLAHPWDHGFLERAVRATDYAPEKQDVASVVRAGLERSQFYVLEKCGRVIASLHIRAYPNGCCAVEGLYREGSPLTLKADLRRLVGFACEKMRERGVRHIYLTVHLDNPIHEKLAEFYRKEFGFKVDEIRMMAPLVAVQERVAR